MTEELEEIKKEIKTLHSRIDILESEKNKIVIEFEKLKSK